MNYSGYGFSGDQKLSFAPLYSKTSNMGTTFTYGVQSLGSVNASNSGTFMSGNYYSVPQSSYYNSYNQWPAINAGYSTPYSGMSSGNSNFYGFCPTSYNSTVIAQPSVDISETTSDVCVTAYIPNVALNDVNLSVTDNSVTISATAWTGVQNVVFNRTVALPTSIHAEAVDANMQSGVLEIRLPKAEKVLRKRNTISQDNIGTTGTSGISGT